MKLQNFGSKLLKLLTKIYQLPPNKRKFGNPPALQVKSGIPNVTVAVSKHQVGEP
jgi:hypothetical protein